MELHAPMISEIEGLLIREFLLCQELLALTREERRALLTGDIHNLALLVERQEVILDEFSQIDEMRRMRVCLLARKLGIDLQEDCCLTEIASNLAPKNAERLLRLHQGILALNADIEELTPGNQSLALAAAGQAFALQRSLLESTHQSQTIRRTTPL